MSDVLSVRGLSVSVRDTALVSGVDLTVGAGERVGLIGESGSGKSLTALSILGLLPEDVRADGSVRLDRVQLPAETLRAYPHQLSGGQRQRVVLALALANDPALLICDEPTTALDVTVQALVLDLIVRGVMDRSSALLFITHDLAVVATVCERVLVMYGGRVVEAGPVSEVFTRPRHRYTEGLLAASDLETTSRRLTTIPGNVPPAGRFPSGCVFRTRCANATALCEELPAWTGSETRGFACHHPAGDADA